MSPDQGAILQPGGRRKSRAYRWIVLSSSACRCSATITSTTRSTRSGISSRASSGFTDENIGWLNSSYSVAAVLTLLIGGWMIDRSGVRLAVAVFSVLCLLGALLTALQVISGDGGRKGGARAGAESLIVAVTAGLAKWFKGSCLVSPSA